jgi:hypothetical protein
MVTCCAPVKSRGHYIEQNHCRILAGLRYLVAGFRLLTKESQANPRTEILRTTIRTTPKNIEDKKSPID